MSTTAYKPVLSEEKPFCTVFTCAEWATWIYSPPGKSPILLCDEHKREWERADEANELGEQEEAAVSSALQDVDPDDGRALWEQCSRVLDAIHEGRL
jgi:hypothetical protein